MNNDLLLGPVPDSERNIFLDVIRGFALLGILVLNIQSFAMPSVAYTNPTVYGDWQGANFWVWYISQLFFDVKLITIFSMLYGAGIMLITERCMDSAVSRARLFSRSFWLLVFGLVHSYLLWYGDILVNYAITGTLVMFARNWQMKTQLIAGLSLILFGLSIYTGFGFAVPLMDEADRADILDLWSPSAQQIEQELQAFRGTYAEQFAQRLPVTVSFQTEVYLMFTLWRTAGLMLIGMALLKSGFLFGRYSERTYVLYMLPGIVVGLPLIAFGLERNLAAGYNWEYSMFFGMSPNLVGSLLLSLTYVSLIIILVKRGALRGVTGTLARVGQMAFTNYLLQTIICTTLFYGFGFGLFGHLDRVGQALVVLSVWVFLMVLSHFWLSYFRFGPFEWVWRSLSYRKIQPMR